MRRLLVLVLLALLLAASGLEAQQGGLGAAAARERQRREEAQKKGGVGKVYTNDDLSKVEATTATPAAPQLAQDAGRRERRGDGSSQRERAAAGGGASGGESDQQQGGPGGKAEAAWRAEAQQNREAVKGAEQKVQALKLRNDRLLAQILASTDTNQILRLRAEQQSINEELEAAQRELALASQMLSQFEESARRAGVPPGWVR